MNSRNRFRFRLEFRILIYVRYLLLPRLAKQRAIAEALSDVDELLRGLEALIAKKRAIKQATMQQLLTGKTRLPGFSRGVGDEAIGGDCFYSQSESPAIERRHRHSLHRT